MTDGCLFDDRPIGIFDSGIGGLTVMSEIAQKMPSESIIYLGDTARVPYGDKSPETIVSYALENAAFLEKHNVKLIIAACNTVSAVALESLREKISVPICGVIESGSAATVTLQGKIVVIGTKTTIASGAYETAIKQVSPQLDVESVACPLLVPLAEEGIKSWNILNGVLDIYLGKYLNNPPASLLLGCTHYPLFIQEFNRFFAGKVKLISSAEAAADYVADMIESGTIKPCSQEQKGEYKFFVTDTAEKFLNSAGRFFGNKIDSAEQVSIIANEQN